MNKEQFYNYLSNPSLLSNINENDIDDIIKEFPYFQSVYKLKAKILADTQSLKFDNQIKTTSLYSIDRRLLFEFINTDFSEKKEEKKVVVEEPISIKIAEEKIIEKVLETSEEPVLEEKEEALSVIEEEVETVDVPETAVKEDIEPVTEIVKEEKTVLEPIVEVDKKPEFVAKEESPVVKEKIEIKDEKKTVVETVSNQKKSIADIVLEKLKYREKDKSEEGIADKILRQARERKEKAKLEAELEEKKKKLITEEHLVEKEPEPIKSHFKEEEELVQEEPVSKTSDMNFSDWLSFVENKDVKPKESKEKSLIDKFISDNPSISISTNKEKKVEIDNNTEDETLKDDFITETLAAIYIKQGHFGKAKSALEKLSLKNPQKNSYFASRIIEVEKLIKK